MPSSKDEAETTFADYFVVAGYDPDIGIVVDNSADASVLECNHLSSERLRAPLQRSYLATIVAHYPQRRATASFSKEILSLCMPKGLRFYTERDVPSEPSVHTFANIREDGQRISGTAITFYEEVREPAIREAMWALQTEHVKDLTRSSRFDRTPTQPGQATGGTHTLPRGRRDRTKRESYYDGGQQNVLYMSKTLCLITRLPLVCATRTALKCFYELVKYNKPPPLPLESYIFWVLNEIPLPSPGTTLKVPLLDTSLVVQRPGLHELPLFDDSMAAMFQFLAVDKFVRLLTCLFLEQQILVCSKEYSRLMVVCESLCALAFPFRWQMVYVPILPYAQLKFIEAPVPYVMGWCYEDSMPETLFQSNVCVIDVDTGRCEFPEDLAIFPGARDLVIEIRKAIERYSNCDENVADVMETSTTTVLPRINGAVRRLDDWSIKRMSRSFDVEDTEELTGEPRRPSRSQLQPLPLEDVLRNNSTFARVAEIARRAGVDVSVDSLQEEFSQRQQCANSPVASKYFQDAKLNNAVRECVLHRIVGMLYSYEHFVVGGQGCTDKESFEASRESLVCFDKASFLSDQPDSHLAFLAAFLETQMFTSFIDAKILSQWEQPDENLVLFDARIAKMRDQLGLAMVRTPTYETSPPFAHTEQLISKREGTLDYVVPGPHELAGAYPTCYHGTWPELNGALLEGSIGLSPAPSPWKQRHTPRSKQDQLNNTTTRPTSTYGGAGLLGDSPATVAQQQVKFVDQLLRETKGKTKRMLVDKMGREAVALGHLDAGITGVEENTLVASFCDLLERIWAHGVAKKQGKSALWAFVLQHQDLEKTGLTSRTMSSSMLSPGAGGKPPPLPIHRRPSLSQSEVPAPLIVPVPSKENLGESLQGIVDSIQKEIREAADADWSRGILRAANFFADKLSARERDAEPVILGASRLPPRPPHSSQTETFGGFRGRGLRKSSSISDFTNPAWGATSESGLSSVEGSPRRRAHSRARSPENVHIFLSPLPTHIAYDLKNVLRMTEIKTDIGYARAFVRLALERKLLHKHLTTLLQHQRLLREHYKPYAFARCDDEKEQFLFHILSLNAAQFRCFTNTFTKTKMDYQVIILTGSWRGTMPGIWITVEGSLGSSPHIQLKSKTLLFKFDHKNLGVLSTLRIGHIATTDGPRKWFLDHVLVRNEITGQTYRFSCGRWFGKGVDDGSLERLLVAEAVEDEDRGEPSVCPPASPARGRRRTTSRSQTPQRERSPSQSRSDSVLRGPPKTQIMEVQQALGEAVNALMKHFFSERRTKSELAPLLCGERGLVSAIEQAFLCGRQDTGWGLRMFRQHYPWDYVENVSKWFLELYRRGEHVRLSRPQREIIEYALRLYRKISEKTVLGKDGRFHVFVLFAVRDHVLSGYLQLMGWTPVTAEMFTESSFFRNPTNLTYLSRLLDSLNEFTFQLDNSLTYGIL